MPEVADRHEQFLREAARYESLMRRRVENARDANIRPEPTARFAEQIVTEVGIYTLDHGVFTREEKG